MKRKEFIRYLKRHGCAFLREGARHSWWWNPELNKRSSIPRYIEIDNSLVRKICKDLGIKEKG
ncbi:MAG: type II toxin-antitoxin system HicA family toxin [Deltaproteobacteria bacterium]|nr:type II toxin-antitoxin system HicA family toxin [Deltaproteobacteria bacterium]